MAYLPELEVNGKDDRVRVWKSERFVAAGLGKGE